MNYLTQDTPYRATALQHRIGCQNVTELNRAVFCFSPKDNPWSGLKILRIVSIRTQGSENTHLVKIEHGFLNNLLTVGSMSSAAAIECLS